MTATMNAAAANLARPPARHHEGYTMLRLSDDSRAILAECEADARGTWDAADDVLTLPAVYPEATADHGGDVMPTYAEVAAAMKAAGLEEIPF
jgi:hypothetical protein